MKSAVEIKDHNNHLPNITKNNNIFSTKTLPIVFMTVPFFIFVLIFSYAPLWGWIIAFIDYNPGIGLFTSKFVGLSNFIQLMTSNSDEFLRVMRNTIVMSLLNIIATPVPIILALMLTQIRSEIFKRIIQTVSSFPNFVSFIIVYSLFFSLLSVDDGLINKILLNTHLIKQPTDILGNASITWMFQLFVTLWKNSGYAAIIYMAAIAGIDQELYSAAKVDGAGTMQQIMHITIPGIMPTYMVILILTIGNILSNGFDQYYIFHNALNHNMIEVLDTYTYRIGITQLNFSLATAIGMFKTIVSIILLVITNSISKRTTDTAIMM